jgi:hypothetical protein
MAYQYLTFDFDCSQVEKLEHVVLSLPLKVKVKRTFESNRGFEFY